MKLEPDQALCSCFRIPVICNSVLGLVVVLELNAVSFDGRHAASDGSMMSG